MKIIIFEFANFQFIDNEKPQHVSTEYTTGFQLLTTQKKKYTCHLHVPHPKPLLITKIT